MNTGANIQNFMTSPSTMPRSWPRNVWVSTKRTSMQWMNAFADRSPSAIRLFSNTSSTWRYCYAETTERAVLILAKKFSNKCPKTWEFENNWRRQNKNRANTGYWKTPPPHKISGGSWSSVPPPLPPPLPPLLIMLDNIIWTFRCVGR